MFDKQKEQEKAIIEMARDKITEMFNQNTFEIKTKLERDYQYATLLEIQ